MPSAKKKIKKKRKPSFTFPKTPYMSNYVNNHTFHVTGARVSTWSAYRSTSSKHVRSVPRERNVNNVRNGIGLDFNRLMHLNNRVVAQLNMLEINRWSQYQRRVSDVK